MKYNYTMRKFLGIIVTSILLAQNAYAAIVNTNDWVNQRDVATVDAVEMDFKSDLKNDFKIYQATLTNKTGKTIDIVIPSNKTAKEEVEAILKAGLTVGNLMTLPKQIAVECYKEDVGTGTIAAAHKGLIYALSTAGATVIGVSMLGIYPQQKTEEFFSHRKIKKEYKKIASNIIGEFSLAPNQQKDLILFVPIEKKAPYVYIQTRQEVEDTHVDYHQL